MWDILFEYKDGTYIDDTITKIILKQYVCLLLIILIFIPIRNLWIIDVSAVQHW